MIRERAELAATRIILLSSGDPAGDRARARELNIDAHLLKPVPPDELLATIYRVMSRADGHASPARQAAIDSAPAVERLHILVAEDNEFNMRHLERLLVRKGHSVRPAYNGREALALLAIGEGPAAAGEDEIGFVLRPSVRSAAPGRPHAGARRLPGHRQDPRARAGRGVSSARHRLDGPLAPRGPRALPGGRDGRIPRQADPGRGSVRGHRPGGLPARCSAAGSRRRPPTARACSIPSSCWPPAATIRTGCAACARISPPIRPNDSPMWMLPSGTRTRHGSARPPISSAACSRRSPRSLARWRRNLEDHAALGHLDEARHLVGRLKAWLPRLLREVDDLSYERLCQQAEAADGHERTNGG